MIRRVFLMIHLHHLGKIKTEYVVSCMYGQILQRMH